MLLDGAFIGIWIPLGGLVVTVTSSSNRGIPCCYSDFNIPDLEVFSSSYSCGYDGLWFCTVSCTVLDDLALFLTWKDFQSYCIATDKYQCHYVWGYDEALSILWCSTLLQTIGIGLQTWCYASRLVIMCVRSSLGMRIPLSCCSFAMLSPV